MARTNKSQWLLSAAERWVDAALAGLQQGLKAISVDYRPLAGQVLREGINAAVRRMTGQADLSADNNPPARTERTNIPFVERAHVRESVYRPIKADSPSAPKRPVSIGNNDARPREWAPWLSIQPLMSDEQFAAQLERILERTRGKRLQ